MAKRPASKKSPDIAELRASDVMTQPVYTCGLHDSANLAAQIMWERDCGAVPIVDDSGKLVGMVTDRDICMAAYFQGAPLSAISIESVMSPDVCGCGPDASVTDVEALMRDKRVRRVPVVDEDMLPVGIISIGDLTRGVERNGGFAGRHGETLMQTMAAVTERPDGRATAPPA